MSEDRNRDVRTALAEQIADLQRDLEQERARIDYLERNKVEVGRVVIVPEFAYTSALSLREAIDQARGFEAADLRSKSEPGSDK